MSLFTKTVVPPITCRTCGHNAYLVRRVPYGDREMHTFECEHCEKRYMRATGDEDSDENVQSIMENMLGRSAPKPLDGQ
jgi:hypothetical protein